MYQSKLIELLRSFDITEFRRFNEFVGSPYFNKNQDLSRFVAYLESLAPDFSEEKLKKETVFQVLYPGEPVDPKRLAYLMNYLLKLAERFLAIQCYEDDGSLTDYHLLQEFIDRKLDKHYGYLLTKSRERLEAMNGRDGEHFYHHFLLSKAASDHFYQLKVRKFDPSLQEVSDKLDDFYFFHKLKYSCEMLNRQAIIQADYQLTFVDEVKSYLLRQAKIDPLIEIYLRIYLSLAFPEEEAHFTDLLGLLERYAHTLDQKTRREVYLYAINYCAPKLRKGKDAFIPVMLDLYMRGIDNRSLFDEDYLSHWTYSNVVKLALRLERYSWIETFIRENVANLPPAVRTDAEHYNLAELYYHQKNYDEVLNHLNQLQFTDLHYHLGSRVMLLKTYYELDNEEPLLSLLAAFSVYLRRHKQISLPMKKTYLNFCQLLHQLMRRNPKKWAALGAEIERTQPLAERAWLLRVWGAEAV